MSRLDDEIVARRQNLKRDPTNLETALRFWKSLSDNGVGNGQYVVEAFRAAVLEGKAGVVSLHTRSGNYST